MKNRSATYRIAFIGVMAAMVYVVTFFRFPLLGSKVHLGNAICLIAGMLLSPVQGGLAAGLGSGLFDLLSGGYDPLQALITFVSKFAMAFVCGKVAGKAALSGTSRQLGRNTVAGVAGALTYVALYMLKTFVYQAWVYAYPMDAVGVTMVSKLIPSLINAGVAVVVAPLLTQAMAPALRRLGIK